MASDEPRFTPVWPLLLPPVSGFYLMKIWAGVTAIASIEADLIK